MATKTAKKHSAAELDSLYLEAETADKELFAEMRSNLLLVAGDHYQKLHANFFKRIRDSEGLSEEVKLRLTKNHIQKISKTYVNNIISLVPGVKPMPKNETELQDQKAAELSDAVWEDGCDRNDMEDLIDDFGDDFVNIGEVACKVFWDPMAGPIASYEQKLDDEGNPLFLDAEGNETTEPGENMAPGEPKYRGDLVFEPIYGFNLLRAPEAKDMKKSPYLIIRKMVDVADLQAQFPDMKEKIKGSIDETLMVFDGQKAQYVQALNQVMVREFYFRPCPQYPQGYYYIAIKEAILAHGELPGGVFPIRFKAFDKIQTSPRGRSPIKTMRPYQAEINRAASKMAEHQITLGDDKLLIQNGTKISAGVALPGVRSINYTGMEPGILQGRTGDQYLNYMNSQITELYDVMNVQEISAEKETGQLDPFALLFRSASQKKKFTRYVRRFESFMAELCETYLKLAKIYLPDDALIYAVGRKEQVNIPEFRNIDDLCYSIKAVPQAEDIESKLGKQMVLNHALQYVGNKLDKEDIGKIMRAMPYANAEESFADMTLDYDSGTNLILALDRGERPELNEYDSATYLIKRLVARKRQADFKFLDPQIQQNYLEMILTLQQMAAQQALAIQRAQQGFIPTDGYMVVCDLYAPDPKDPLKTKRMKLPYGALMWLVKQLEAQGQSLEQLEAMNQGALAQMAQMMPQAGQQDPIPNGMGAGDPLQGAGMPGGVEYGTPAAGYGAGH